jgi:hypothetical protein
VLVIVVEGGDGSGVVVVGCGNDWARDMMLLCAIRLLRVLIRSRESYRAAGSNWLLVRCATIER